jgi:hypothetical protein
VELSFHRNRRSSIRMILQRILLRFSDDTIEYSSSLLFCILKSHSLKLLDSVLVGRTVLYATYDPEERPSCIMYGPIDPYPSCFLIVAVQDDSYKNANDVSSAERGELVSLFGASFLLLNK